MTIWFGRTWPVVNDQTAYLNEKAKAHGKADGDRLFTRCNLDKLVILLDCVSYSDKM